MKRDQRLRTPADFRRAREQAPRGWPHPLLVLYVHLAYSVDLQQFFGKQGWYSAQFVERERHEYPWQVGPFWSWDQSSIVPAGGATSPSTTAQ